MPRLRLLLLTIPLVGGAVGCDGGQCMSASCMPMKDPPQVFLTTLDSLAIGKSVKVKVQVQGCEKVQGIEILNDKKFLASITSPAKLPVDIEMPASLFVPLFQTLGLAVKLNLRARGICDDGRENKSTALGVSFFPVENVVEPVAGNSTALPDSFIAEGGAGGVPTTFIGCVGTQDGLALARFDSAGNVIGANTMLPATIGCSYNSSISDKDLGSGIRWLIEPGKGVFAFNSNPGSPLNITASQSGVIPNMGVGPDGDALIWDSKAFAAANFFRIAKNPGIANAPPVWSAQVQGIMAGTPVVSQNEVRVIMWEGMLGQFSGTMAVWRFRYDNGGFISRNALATIEYGEFNDPIIPAANFNKSGTLVYFAFQNLGAARKTSQIVACASDSTTGCLTGGGSSWVSPLFEAVVVAAVPFANGSLVAAVAGKRTYFLNAQTGALVNNFDLPIIPDGNLVTLGAQPGNGTDFYLLNGNSGTYPTEIIAVDSPQMGELWRVQIEGGNVPLTALNMAIDEGNQAWLRVGPKLVKPSALTLYRQQKGMNLPPPDAG